MTDQMSIDERSDYLETAHGSSDKLYVLIALFLAVMTAIEVAVSYAETTLGKVAVPLLLTLMVIKFFSVAWYFMHLKNDPKMARRVFAFGLSVAVIIFTVMLSTFRYWAPGFR